MYTKGIIRKGEYFDSVSLMLVAGEINKLPGIIDSGVVMGTKENRSILDASGILLKEFENSGDTDLLIAIKAESQQGIDNAISKIEELLANIRNKKSDDNVGFKPKSLDSALEKMPDANLSIISVAGKYAAYEAYKALDNGLHVMIFSDNIAVEDELKLKTIASEKGLLVMGPDCGTAIINGVPLAFANAVNKGDIGIVAASGTGLQEVSCLISEAGCGISQAIGTGGRDVKKEIGGIMFIQAMKALAEDNNTKVILLVSKPPHTDTLAKIADEAKKINKPIVAIFIGANHDIAEKAGMISAVTLEEAALIAVKLSKNLDYKDVKADIIKRNQSLIKRADELAKKTNGKYLRGLFSGGTLCDETQLIFKDIIGFVNSNIPLNKDFKLQNVWKSVENTVIDLGDDEFTVGRPHPMIDFSLRMKKFEEEAIDKEVAVILLDIVIGYGSHNEPLSELLPVLNRINAKRNDLVIICSVTGTANDPQNKKEIVYSLQNSGVIVVESNAAASILGANIIKLKGDK